MELKQALGNTWYLDDWQLIPLYKLDAHRCILLDSGLYEQRQEIEDTLQSAGLTPVGILGTHATTTTPPTTTIFNRNTICLWLCLWVRQRCAARQKT